MSESGSKMSELKVVYNQAKQKRYERGAFIGKGQIGQCYELVDTDTQGQAVYAAKIVPQSLLVTSLRNGNWKRKWEQKNTPITGALFLHSVLSHYSCILHRNGYRTGFMSCALPLTLVLCFVITAFL